MEKLTSKSIDLIFGGGEKSFIPAKNQSSSTNGMDFSIRNDSKNLLKTWKDQGGTHVRDLDSLDKLDHKDMPILGLFANSHLHFEGTGTALLPIYPMNNVVIE